MISSSPLLAPIVDVASYYKLYWATVLRKDALSCARAKNQTANPANREQITLPLYYITLECFSFIFTIISSSFSKIPVFFSLFPKCYYMRAIHVSPVT